MYIVLQLVFTVYILENNLDFHCFVLCNVSFPLHFPSPSVSFPLSSPPLPSPPLPSPLPSPPLPSPPLPFPSPSRNARKISPQFQACTTTCVTTTTRLLSCPVQSVGRSYRASGGWRTTSEPNMETVRCLRYTAMPLVVGVHTEGNFCPLTVDLIPEFRYLRD